MVLRGNQQRENKQNYPSIIAHNLQQKRRYLQTIKLFGRFYHRLLVMWRPNWIYCLIDMLPERLPMCHRSKNCSRHCGFTALSVPVAMVMYLQCYHAHQSAPIWCHIDQDFPSGILSVIIWLQRQSLCDTWGWDGRGVGTGRKWRCRPHRQHHIPEAPAACCPSAWPGAGALSLVVSVGMQGEGRLMPPSYAVIALCDVLGGRGDCRVGVQSIYK